MNRKFRILQIVILALSGAASVLLFGFSAEDAFITYRYAENFATSGAFVFNLGEPVLALTSPLHGLTASLLFRLTGDTVLASKLFGLLLVLAAAALVWRRYAGEPFLQTLVTALILLPPCVILWTFGGLETPLLLFLATLATVLAVDTGDVGPSRTYQVFLLAGLAFVTRFDSVLFTGPLALYIACRARDPRHVAAAAVVGGAVPAAWLIVSATYYGDILPTSFYSKAPQTGLPVLIGNGKYVLFYLFVVGMIPAALLVLALCRPWLALPGIVVRHLTGMWWLTLGIGAQLLYGLTMATTHMMFSFRYFVPYLPALAILIAELARRILASRETPPSDRWLGAVAIPFLVCLAVFQGFQLHHTYEKSINGLSPWGEYRAVGARQYEVFIDTLALEAEDIRAHWQTVQDGRARFPRIYTFAGGVLPYRFRESYIYETLVSYRHCYDESDAIQAPNVWMKSAIDLRAAADYIHVIAPRHGFLAPQLPLPEGRLSLVSSYEIEFDGFPETMLVFYNPEPEPHRLTGTIDGLCTPATAAN